MVRDANGQRPACFPCYGEPWTMGTFRGKFAPHQRFLKPSAGMRIAFYVMALMIASLTGAQPVGSGKAEDIAALLKSASTLHERSDYAHSIPILQRVVRLSPRSYEANLLLGEDLLRSGKPREALAPLRTASALKNDDLVAPDYMMMAAAAAKDTATESEA